MKAKFERYFAIAAPVKGYIKIMRQVYLQSPNGHKKKQLRQELIKTVPITIEIPIEEYKTEVTHFDSTGIQMDDRLWTETVKGKRYSPEVLNRLCDEAMIGYEKEPRVID